VGVPASPAAARAIDRAPALLDLIQGVSGALLVVFMWVHMGLVSSILVSEEAMYRVARFFEGSYFFGRPHPELVTGIAGAIFLLVAVHALAALRRIPSSYREYRILYSHSRGFRHADTWLWLIQVATGMLLMFLVGVHLYTMMTHPADIGPYESADRFVSGRMWPLYLVLLFAVELHGGIGLYRLVLKWGLLPPGPDPRARRRRLARIKWAITGFFIVLGLATFAAYVEIGLAHADRAGERYLPPAAGAASHAAEAR